MAEVPRICSHCGKTFHGEASVCPDDGYALFEAPADEHVGKVLNDQYRLEALLGAGAFGRVYTSTDLAIGRRVAIKLLRLDVAGAERTLQRFFKEAKVLASLKHRNTVSVYHLFQAKEAGGAPALVMEFVEGQPLEDILSGRGPLPWREVAALSIQICEALAYTHRKGIVHRDLKPANIMVCQDEEESGVVKVLDFGIAKMSGEGESLTATGALLGTPTYMSPEQVWEGSKEAGPWTDIYALGVILYEALSGRLPHTGNDTRAILLAKVEQPPEPLFPEQLDNAVPVPLANLIMSMLHKSPAERPASADVVRQQLERMLAASSEEAEEDPALSDTLDSPTNLADLMHDAGATVEERPAAAVAPKADRPQDADETKGYEERTGFLADDKMATSPKVVAPPSGGHKPGIPWFVWPVAALLAVVTVVVVWQPWKEMLGSGVQEDVTQVRTSHVSNQPDIATASVEDSVPVANPADLDERHLDVHYPAQDIKEFAPNVSEALADVYGTNPQGIHLEADHIKAAAIPTVPTSQLAVADVTPGLDVAEPPALADVGVVDVTHQPAARPAVAPEVPAEEPVVIPAETSKKKARREEKPEVKPSAPQPVVPKRKEPPAPVESAPDAVAPAHQHAPDPAPVDKPPKPITSPADEEEELEDMGEELRKSLDSEPIEAPSPIEPPKDEEDTPAKGHHDSMRDKLDSEDWR